MPEKCLRICASSRPRSFSLTASIVEDGEAHIWLSEYCASHEFAGIMADQFPGGCDQPAAQDRPILYLPREAAHWAQGDHCSNQYSLSIDPV